MIAEAVNTNRLIKNILKPVQKIWKNQSSILALILLFVFGSIISETFLTTRNITNILQQVSIIGIISIGMTIVIISGGIDLSVGSVLALSGVFCISVLNMTSSIAAAVLLTFVFALTLGTISGLLITRGKVAPFIATLVIMSASRSIALFWISGGSINGRSIGFNQISNTKLLGLYIPVYYFIVIIVVMYILMKKTKLGRYIYAVGGNERAAVLAAIDVKQVKMIVYMIMSSLVALSAIIEGAKLNSISSSSSGNAYEMDAIAAVIIGGTKLDGGKGTIVGTVIGVLILGLLNNILNLMQVSPFLQGAVKGVIIIIAVLLQKKNTGR